MPNAAIAQALSAVRADIAAAATASGRSPDAVMLTAVSKTQPTEALQAALAAGQRVFGENRVQEAQGKWPALRAAYPDLELRLIGPLQTNKVKEAVALFDAIESVDRDKLAEHLARELRAQNKRLRLLVQVNVGEEDQKAGVAPAEAEAFVRRCRDVHGLTIEGLMCVPPADQPPAPYFALLADMAARLGLSELSMGMSADYATAIRFGATHVRVGTAIFGTRPPVTASAPTDPLTA